MAYLLFNLMEENESAIAINPHTVIKFLLTSCFLVSPTVYGRKYLDVMNGLWIFKVISLCGAVTDY